MVQKLINSDEYVKKSVVRDVAMRYAREHDWCGTVEVALREMGIKKVTKTAKVTVEITFEDLPVNVNEDSIDFYSFHSELDLDYDQIVMHDYKILKVELTEVESS